MGTELVCRTKFKGAIGHLRPGSTFSLPRNIINPFIANQRTPEKRYVQPEGLHSLVSNLILGLLMSVTVVSRSLHDCI